MHKFFAFVLFGSATSLDVASTSINCSGSKISCSQQYHSTVTMPSVALCYSGEMRTLFVPAIGLDKHRDFANGFEANVWYFWSIRPQNFVPYGPNVTNV